MFGVHLRPALSLILMSKLEGALLSTPQTLLSPWSYLLSCAAIPPAEKTVNGHFSPDRFPGPVSVLIRQPFLCPPFPVLCSFSVESCSPQIFPSPAKELEAQPQTSEAPFRSAQPVRSPLPVKASRFFHPLGESAVPSNIRSLAVPPPCLTQTPR